MKARVIHDAVTVIHQIDRTNVIVQSVHKVSLQFQKFITKASDETDKQDTRTEMYVE